MIIFLITLFFLNYCFKLLFVCLSALVYLPVQIFIISNSPLNFYRTNSEKKIISRYKAKNSTPLNHPIILQGRWLVRLYPNWIEYRCNIAIGIFKNLPFQKNTSSIGFILSFFYYNYTIFILQIIFDAFFIWNLLNNLTNILVFRFK